MNRRDILIAYMKSCIDIEDWHGVSDAANDLRELDAGAKGGTYENADSDGYYTVRVRVPR